MDWLCPGFSTVLHAQLAKNFGSITAENTIRDITAITQTGLYYYVHIFHSIHGALATADRSGTLQVTVYDLTQMIVHTANARRDG